MKIMKLTTITLAAICLSASASANELKCKIQAIGNFSTVTKRLNIELSQDVEVKPEIPVTIDYVGQNDKKKYVVRIDSRLMTNGTFLEFGIYENFKQTESGSTGKPLVYGSSLYGAVQPLIQLQLMGGDTILAISCTR